MNERKLDPVTGDIAVDDGHVVRTSSYEESVMQTVKTYLSTFQGECFTDGNAGVPWFDDILGRDVLYSDYSTQVIKEKILEVPGVRSVDKVNVTFEGRRLSGNIRITLDNGERRKMEL